MKGSTVVLIAAGVVGYVLYMGAGSDGNVTLGVVGAVVIGLALLAVAGACLMSKDKGLKFMGLCLIALIVTVALGHSPTELGDWLVGNG